MASAPHSAPAPSLENLVESGAIPLESLHPGGLSLTAELAAQCAVGADSRVLDVASGTGESACFLAGQLGARVVGVDRSAELLDRGRAKAAARGVDVRFVQADAARLPFRDDVFDAAICECTLCFLDKPATLAAMARVVRSGGHVGMHDLCWRPDAPGRVRDALARLEGEYPETAVGWRSVFEAAGLTDVRLEDRSDLKRRWMRESQRNLGVPGMLRLAAGVTRRWGPRGLWRILRAQHVFDSPHLGYVLVAARKP